MQDLASKFSKKISGGDTSGPKQREGATPFRTNPHRLLARAPVLGPKPWSPLNFSAVVAPLSVCANFVEIV